MKNFGKIKNTYNTILVESIITKDGNKKKEFSKYVKTLKENKALEIQFFIYNNIENKIENLKKLVNKIELLKSSIESVNDSNKVDVQNVLNTKNIFIVHGHDDKAKLEVTRTIEKLELNPIILHEQANGGKTIIEKFEANSSEAGFAIVILTCDDKVGDEKFRARQNVVFEMGYFIGKLGRENVALLYENGVELPSDINGLVYLILDEGGRWKFSLVKELKESGYIVDANNLL